MISERQLRQVSDNLKTTQARNPHTEPRSLTEALERSERGKVTAVCGRCESDFQRYKSYDTVKYCPSCSEAISREYQRREQEAIQSDREKRFKSRIPPLFHSARMGDLNINLRKAIADKPFEQGLLLWGGVGTGKTHTAAAYAYDVIMQDKGVRRLTFKDLLLAVRGTYDSNQTEREVYASLLNPSVLILEDVATGKQTDFTTDTLLHVIDSRIEHNKPTIITSNLSPENLEAVFGQRVGSRFSTFKIIKLGGRDKRKG